MQSEQRKQRESKNKSSKNRVAVCMAVTLICFGIFAARLVDWQLIQGKSYKELSANSIGYTVKTDATRGEILDCNGKELVANKTHYKIVIDKLYADNKTLDSTILKLMNILSKTGDSWEDTLPIEFNGKYTYKKDAKDEVNTLLTQYLYLPENTSAEDCFNALVLRYKLDGDYNISQLLSLVSVHYNMEITGYSNSEPYIFAKDISQSAVIAVSENMQGVSGVDVQTYLVRQAENPDLAPHLIGALGSITEEEYVEKKKADKDYMLTDKIGKFGIELAYEDILRGKSGAKIVQKNSDGAVVDTLDTINAQPGSTIYLTIDSKLQKTAVEALAQNIKAAKAEGVAEQKLKGKKGYGEDCQTGAVVMLSVKDFSVLAAASYPTYDLNKYSKYGSYYIKLAQDKTSPLYNRAFVGSFATGSVYKPCVALAALEENIVNEKTQIYCKQNYDYYPTNVVKCMHYHGNLNINGAITHSCNYFFAEAGRRLGIDTMYLYAQKFGLGEYTGVEVEESKGFLAGRDSTKWQAGNTVQAAIGQSDNAFTPLQLATYTATIANDGTRLKTHTVKKITNYERSKVIEDAQAQMVDYCGVSQKNIHAVQKAMLSVTQSENGTANSVFGNYKIKVAAKTGTAENAGSDHTTFICYAPYEKPEVAVAVVLEHGKRGKYSMQVAKELLDAYFSE